MGAMTETLAPGIAEVQELLVGPDQSSHVGILAQGYEYTHTDGTVYHAENAERAMAICPVLGEIALNEVELLLEVAAIGQQKLDQERSKVVDKQPEPQKLKPEKSVFENLAKSPKSDVISHITAKDLGTNAKHNEAGTPIANDRPLLGIPNALAKEANNHSTRSIKAMNMRDTQKENAQAMYRAAHIDFERTYSEAFEAITNTSIDKSGSSEEIATGKSTRQSVINSPKSVVAPAEEFIDVAVESEAHSIILATGEVELPVSIFEEDDEYEKLISLTTLGAVVTEEAEITAGKLPSIDSNEQTTWTHELEKGPEEIYKNFAKALHTLISTPVDESLTVVNNEVAINDELADENEACTEQPILNLVAKVAERLSERAEEGRDIIVKHVISIVETLQILNTYEAQEVQIAQIKLEALIKDLFEQLGVEHEINDVEQFISVLLRPDFQPAPPKKAQNRVDLERDGTHEAKRNFTQVVGDVAEEIERDVMLLIGTLALFRAMTKQSIYA